jgi:hypothetical protein
MRVERFRREQRLDVLLVDLDADDKLPFALTTAVNALISGIAPYRRRGRSGLNARYTPGRWSVLSA